MANAETPARRRRPKEETARLGDEIYRRDVKAQVEADRDGEYVAIDVDSGTGPPPKASLPHRTFCCAVPGRYRRLAASRGV